MWCVSALALSYCEETCYARKQEIVPVVSGRVLANMTRSMHCCSGRDLMLG